MQNRSTLQLIYQFILPNPVYGEWQRLYGDNPRGKLKVTAMKQVAQ
ncbi:MAG: hypothetical protein J2P56_05660 [Verrucomicrobia bacterium]|nr:hypothetical protein [Verrucomicrobiota bacterium]